MVIRKKETKILKVCLIALSIVVFLNIPGSVMGAIIYSGTCQSDGFHVYAGYLNLSTKGWQYVYVNGTMNSEYVLIFNGKYVTYDSFEINGTISLGSPGSVRIDVGYAYGSQSYRLISGTGSVTVTQFNSTTIEYSIQGKGVWEFYVDSNQSASISGEMFQLAVTAITGAANNMTEQSMEAC